MNQSRNVAGILVLFMLVSLLFATPVYAQDLNVTVDGRLLAFDVDPVIIEGRTLVPLRGVFEALEATVTWDEATRTVTARRGDTTVTLPIGSRFPLVNGVSVELAVPGFIINGRTMVPARFIAESLGAEVDWNEHTRTVVITRPDAGLPQTKTITRIVEGMVEDLFVTLYESPLGYAIYYEEDRISVETHLTKDVFLSNFFAEINMEIEYMEDQPREAYMETLFQELSDTYENVDAGFTAVTEPLVGYYISAHTYDETEDAVIFVYLVEDVIDGGLYVIRQHMFLEAVEGMVPTFNAYLGEFVVTR